MKKEPKPSSKEYSVIKEIAADIAIPKSNAKLDSEWETIDETEELTGYWLVEQQVQKKSSHPRSILDVLSLAEIETASPTVPLHAEHRIEYDDYDQQPVDPSAQWSFGQQIEAEPLDFVKYHQSVLADPEETQLVVSKHSSKHYAAQVQEADLRLEQAPKPEIEPETMPKSEPEQNLQAVTDLMADQKLG